MRMRTASRTSCSESTPPANQAICGDQRAGRLRSRMAMPHTVSESAVSSRPAASRWNISARSPTRSGRGRARGKTEHRIELHLPAHRRPMHPSRPSDTSHDNPCTSPNEISSRWDSVNRAPDTPITPVSHNNVATDSGTLPLARLRIAVATITRSSPPTMFFLRPATAALSTSITHRPSVGRFRQTPNPPSASGQSRTEFRPRPSGGPPFRGARSGQLTSLGR